jgi:hypothetical protein
MSELLNFKHEESNKKAELQQLYENKKKKKQPQRKVSDVKQRMQEI